MQYKVDFELFSDGYSASVKIGDVTWTGTRGSNRYEALKNLRDYLKREKPEHEIVMVLDDVISKHV
jgi:hypothetical protein